MVDLKECLLLHKLWLEGDVKGVRANLSGANLSHANLSGENLYRANLYGANLYGARLSRANLYGADLYRARLYGADLSGANLSRANLYGADLSHANLYGADLSHANLYGVDLSRADLSKTLLEGKVFLTFMYKKHTAYFFGLDEITIGCHKKTISQWLTSFAEIGKKEEYTEEEIKMYGKFIKQCAKTYSRSNK